MKRQRINLTPEQKEQVVTWLKQHNDLEVGSMSDQATKDLGFPITKTHVVTLRTKYDIRKKGINQIVSRDSSPGSITPAQRQRRVIINTIKALLETLE